MYNPSSSRMAESTLADFITSPLTGVITEVPGISPKQAILLSRGDYNDQITNTYQLIGKFLLMKTINQETNEYITSQEHCDKFCMYLKNKGVNSHRTDITFAIAEKCNVLFPGIYNYTEFQ